MIVCNLSSFFLDQKEWSCLCFLPPFRFSFHFIQFRSVCFEDCYLKMLNSLSVHTNPCRWFAYFFRLFYHTHTRANRCQKGSATVNYNEVKPIPAMCSVDFWSFWRENNVWYWDLFQHWHIIIISPGMFNNLPFVMVFREVGKSILLLFLAPLSVLTCKHVHADTPTDTTSPRKQLTRKQSKSF